MRLQLKNLNDFVLDNELGRFNAQHGIDPVVVYQAFGDDIAHYALKHQQFGGGFSFNRRSWIKTSFFWMMYRSGWGSKEGQNRVLAVGLKRDFFDDILRVAVPTQSRKELYNKFGFWNDSYNAQGPPAKAADVVVQLDPERSYKLGKLKERRAVQLGLKGTWLTQYATTGICWIEDITRYVMEQYELWRQKRYSSMQIPQETPYIPKNENPR